MNGLIKNELTLDSREVAEMVDKNHSHLLRDIRGYEESISTNPKLDSLDFFIPNIYKDKKGEDRPSYLCTKKGCEFIAHKLTGQKGAIFTATYINKFHEMERTISQDSYMIQDPVERAKKWIQEQRQKQLLELQIKEDKPKVLFAEAVENSDDVILVKEMAHIITQNGFSIGQNQLYQYLRDYGFLCKKEGDMYHLPTRRYEHFFKVTKRLIQSSKGTMTKNTPKITGKGQLYFIDKFNSYKEKGKTIKDLLIGESA